MDPILTAITQLRNPLFDNLLFMITWLGPLLVVLSLTLFENKDKDMKKYIIGVIATLIIIYSMKYFFKIPRPEEAMLFEFSPAFPSLHAGLMGFWWVFMVKRYKKDATIITAITALVSFSRLYFGVHYLLDVITGLLIGLLIGAIIDRKIDFKKHTLKK
jgi:membrane-associated phospholipid phosphatase